MIDSGRSSSQNSYVSDPPDSLWFLVTDPTEPAKKGRDRRLTYGQFKSLIGALSAFSAIRTTNLAIGAGEFRLPYDCSSGNITPTLPTPTNGRPLWFYNDGASGDLIITNVEGSITETLSPGSRLALVGNGTIWRYQ